MTNNMIIEAIAAVLMTAEEDAGKVAIDLIRTTASWDQCDAHGVYHRRLGDMLAPWVNWARENYPSHEATQQYEEGFITGSEYLRFLVVSSS